MIFEYGLILNSNIPSIWSGLTFDINRETWLRRRHLKGSTQVWWFWLLWGDSYCSSSSETMLSIRMHKRRFHQKRRSQSPKRRWKGKGSSKEFLHRESKHGAPTKTNKRILMVSLLLIYFVSQDDNKYCFAVVVIGVFWYAEDWELGSQGWSKFLKELIGWCAVVSMHLGD